MDVQQMIQRLLAGQEQINVTTKTNQERMEAKIEANQGKTDVSLG
jgi:hypothetical protein